MLRMPVRLVGMAAILLVASGTVVAQSNRSEESWEDSPYHNEDEWYDPTGWFDGNNYGFDRQAYRASARGMPDGRPARRTDDRWLYDFYTTGYAVHYDQDGDGIYEYSYRYFDFDNDGVYDAFAGYFDRDSDGVYEDYSYYSFTGRTAQPSLWERLRRVLTGTPGQSARERRVEGEVLETRRVSVRDREHLLARVQEESGDEVLVDLGPARDLARLDLREGETVSARGPEVVAGDNCVVLARTVQSGGRTEQIERAQRRIEGEITQLEERSVRGQPHTLATIETDSGRETLIDLGRSESVEERLGLEEGDRLAVSGALVRVRGQNVLMATEAEADDRTLVIDRSVGRGRPDRATIAGRRERQQREQPRRQSPSSQRQEFRVTGNVMQTERVDVEGTPHRVVRVTSEEDRMICHIDLGPDDRLDFDVEQGDRLSARGLLAMAKDEPLLLARSAELEGETVRIDRDDQERRISGEVVDVQSARVRGAQRLVAEIETLDEERILADLGRRDALTVEPEQGDSISVEGLPARVQQQEMIVATRIRLGDQTVRIERPEEAGWR